MAVRPWNVASICAGGGGLDLAIRLALPTARSVVYVERDVAAATSLVEAMQDEGGLHEAPVWSDVCTFDPEPWRGVVDLVSAGFPCTDISPAGKREGIYGKHSSLWWNIRDTIRDLGPELVVLENSDQLTIRGLDAVLGSLDEIGFDAEWTTLSAGACGAPHRRNRCWIVAHAKGCPLRILPEREQLGSTERGDAAPRHSGQEMGDPDGTRREGSGDEVGRGSGESGPDALADPNRDGFEELRSSGLLDRERSPCGDDSHGCGEGSPAWPPGRDAPPGGILWDRWLRVEPDTEPGFPRSPDGMARSRELDRLFVTGNGVVPVVGALAILSLIDRLKN